MIRDETHDARGAFIRSIAMVLVAFLTPVCVTLALGGADWECSDRLGVSWYGEWIAWPLWVVAAACVLWRPRPGRATDVFAGAGLILFGLATLIFWTGGDRWNLISLRSADPSGFVGLALMGLASVGGWRRVRSRAHGAFGLALALTVGGSLQIMLMRFDATRIDGRISSVPQSGDAASTPPSPPAGPDVVWIVVDTLRADALGAYRERGRPGGESQPATELPRTPFLDRLAARGRVFDRVRSTAPWTLPSMMSAFTSRWPSTLDPEGRGRARTVDDLIGLDPATPTWIDVLRDAGYHTAGFQKNPFLARGSGFEAHFDFYRLVGGDRAEAESGAQLARSVLRWADRFARERRRGRTSPYLLYVHFMEPHVDYRPPAPWLSESARDYDGAVDGSAKGLHDRIERGVPIEADERDQLRRLYASEVAYLDAMIERLVLGLEARGLLDGRTLVVLSSDHGEQFDEHGGWEHGDLHVENVHVPFLLAGAGVAAGRDRRTLSALDIGPTILAAAGFESFESAEGRSRLTETSEEEPDSAPIAVFSEYGERTRIELDPWILIEGGEGSVVLYDGVSDPGETHDLAAQRPEVVRALRARLEAHRTRDRPTADARERTSDRRTIEMLRELGYVD